MERPQVHSIFFLLLVLLLIRLLRTVWACMTINDSSLPRLLALL